MIEITPYNSKYLQQHVELGKRATKDWKYFGQTPLDIMRLQYDRSDFDPETRLYAIGDGQLWGFCTADVVRKGFARVEFPITEPEDIELGKKLFNQQLAILNAKDVKTIQTRVSKFWGNTKIYADIFNFEHYKDLYFVIHAFPEELIDQINLKQLNLVKYNESHHRSQTKEILINWFDTSETLAETYLNAYKENPPSLVLNHYLTENGKIVGRITLSQFEQNGIRRQVGTLYCHEDYSQNFKSLLAKLKLEMDKYEVSNGHIYLAGLPYNKIKLVFNSQDIDPVISLYRKSLI